MTPTKSTPQPVSIPLAAPTPRSYPNLVSSSHISIETESRGPKLRGPRRRQLEAPPRRHNHDEPGRTLPLQSTAPHPRPPAAHHRRPPIRYLGAATTTPPHGVEPQDTTSPRVVPSALATRRQRRHRHNAQLAKSCHRAADTTRAAKIKNDS